MNDPDGKDDENAAQDAAGRDWEGVEWLHCPLEVIPCCHFALGY
jgi:hypothetical protein